MMKILVILWDCLLGFGGWYLYRHPRLLEKGKTEPRQVRINRIGGIVVMLLGAGCAFASMLQLLVKTSK